MYLHCIHVGVICLTRSKVTKPLLFPLLSTASLTARPASACHGSFVLQETVADELEEAYRSRIWDPSLRHIQKQKQGVTAARVELTSLFTKVVLLFNSNLLLPGLKTPHFMLVFAVFGRSF